MSVISDTTGETNRSAQLLDSGNLVVFSGDGNGNGKGILVDWQSFDHPTNTWLPNMKLGVDRRIGLNRFLTSWKSVVDPGTGEYSCRMDLTGPLPQFFLYNESVPVWRTGPWIGHGWSGVPEMTSGFDNYVDNSNEVTMVNGMLDPSVLFRMVLNEAGTVERLTWHDGNPRWIGFWHAPNDQCDYYSHCGANGICHRNPFPGQFECTCLPGFEPNSTRDWYLRDGSGGCVRERGGHVCKNGEGFVKVEHVKVPNTWTALVERSMGQKECEKRCLRNCTCNGFASVNVSQGESGIGCVAWYGDLVDTVQFSSGGQDLFVRVDEVEYAQYLKTLHTRGNRHIVVAIMTPIVAVLLFIIGLLWWFKARKKKVERRNRTLLIRSKSLTSLETSSMGNQFDESVRNPELPAFDLSTIVAATDNFSFANKLGQGGFGIVYKGRLFNGEEIAVKRLGKNSGQGVEEFKTEVKLIAKLQHRNLVRLLGYCIRKEEKMLIYEYLPNKSLDFFIFDKTKGSFVNWRNRFNIIVGIARGLLYLHQDSRLRIIHRDLKASNVLLDAAMNPKISDFGMAKIFRGDQIEANTNRVVGTYGYMSPEYAMEGLFSVKSDVFSFGVLVLEIVSGRKNNSYYQENSMNLIGNVWSLWKEGQTLDMVDSTLSQDSYPASEVVRCIHIGLLCVQDLAIDRPTTSDVAFMLCNESATLPSPKQPVFIFKRTVAGADSSSTSAGGTTLGNDVTMTAIQAR
ncbi:hypothetical protein U1Q18_008997 [Sarracenia purpurea var. burkii]